jgi:putative glutamine amidotransferase
MTHPLIGITTDSREEAAGLMYFARFHYSEAVAAAGGVPVLLPHEPQLAATYVERCDGLLLSGGDDPRMEPFGEPTHPQATPMHERRQAFELAMLEALADRVDKPVLGVCLGMQMMALAAGGSLHQHLPDICPQAAAHRRQEHEIVLTARDSLLCRLAGCESRSSRAVYSNHHQAVSSGGSLRVTAWGPGEVIEAIEDPARRFYLGVQWHPERGDDGPLSRGLVASLVRAAHRAT